MFYTALAEIPACFPTILYCKILGYIQLRVLICHENILILSHHGLRLQPSLSTPLTSPG